MPGSLRCPQYPHPIRSFPSSPFSSSLTHFSRRRRSLPPPPLPLSPAGSSSELADPPLSSQDLPSPPGSQLPAWTGTTPTASTMATTTATMTATATATSTAPGSSYPSHTPPTSDILPTIDRPSTPRVPAASLLPGRAWRLLTSTRRAPNGRPWEASRGSFALVEISMAPMSPSR